jgi:hypothetical protein
MKRAKRRSSGWKSLGTQPVLRQSSLECDAVVTTVVFTVLWFAGCHHWLVSLRVVGHSAEFRAIADFLGSVNDQPTGLLVEGEADIGTNVSPIRNLELTPSERRVAELGG